MIRTMISALALAALACSGAFANERVDNIDLGVMRAVVEHLGDEVTGEITLDDGTPILQARSTSGIHYTLAGTACNQDQCFGMASVIEFNNDAGLTPEHTNSINARWAAVKVLLRDNSIELSRYDVADGGTTTEALAASVATLVAVTGSIVTSLRQQ